MTLTEKRKEKKLTKLYGWLATASLLFWVLEWVVMTIVRNHTVGEWKINVVLLLSIFIIPPFVSLFLWMISGTHQNKLLMYKKDIKEFRVRRAFQKCMEYIEAGDLNMARNIYNDYIPTKHPTRDYLYSLLIWLMSKSEDAELKETGLKKVNYLRDFYQPDKIKL